MRVVENKTIYRCEHGNCKKYLLTESAMRRHEIHCKHNPKNQHACFKWCKHLLKEKEEGTTYFYCKKTRKTMWSYKIEKSVSFHEAVYGIDERMPTECEHYEEIPLEILEPDF